MQNNKTYRLYPKAIQDLESIYLYSMEEFGLNRAENYIRKIEECFQSIAKQPEMARRCDFIRANLKVISVESHVIFFKVIKKELVIIRVLHKTMDFMRHF